MRRLPLTYIQMIALGFFLIIITGGLILSLPVSSRDGSFTPIVDSIFTASSATCVTGLVVYDTYTHWSLFGQIVIITLIQIGGLGFMSLATLFSMMLHRKIGLRERELMKEAANTTQLGGIVRFTKHILVGTFIFEGIGAFLLSLRFIPKMGLVRGIYNGVFHSVSAFCNAGFDIMGKYGKFTSLTTFHEDYLVNIVIMSLIVIGGIGFYVWDDIRENKLRVKSYHLHTKIVLTTTACLIVIPAIAIFFIEQNGVLKGMSTPIGLLASFFQSVTARTAGFNTVDTGALKSPSLLIVMALMFIGGSPGSTAGGIKTSTFAVIVISMVAVIKNRSTTFAFRRRFEDDVLKRACSVFFIYLGVAFVSAVAMGIAQGFTMEQIFFEIFSAIGTVGLTTGITPHLCTFSRILIACLMYFGRVGILSMAAALVKTPEYPPVLYPTDKILIG
ncbi:MAG: potassium transporter TrkG [Bacillota bacterium]|nr:potassium transporter TrkG [Bacillota bacterium]